MEQNAFGTQQAGQPANPEANPSANGQAAPNQTQPEMYVTPQQLEERLAAAIKRSESRTQSMVDTSRNKIYAQIDSFASAGIKVTPEQAAAFIQQEEQTNQSPVPAQPAAQPADASAGNVDTEKANWIQSIGGKPDDQYFGMAYEISKDAGLSISADDPEVSYLQKQFDSGPAFVAAYSQAVAAKQSRIQQDAGFAATPGRFGTNRTSKSVPNDAPYEDIYREAFR